MNSSMIVVCVLIGVAIGFAVVLIKLVRRKSKNTIKDFSKEEVANNVFSRM